MSSASRRPAKGQAPAKSMSSKGKREIVSPDDAPEAAQLENTEPKNASKYEHKPSGEENDIQGHGEAPKDSLSKDEISSEASKSDSSQRYALRKSGKKDCKVTSLQDKAQNTLHSKRKRSRANATDDAELTAAQGKRQRTKKTRSAIKNFESTKTTDEVKRHSLPQLADEDDDKPGRTKISKPSETLGGPAAKPGNSVATEAQPSGEKLSPAEPTHGDDDDEAAHAPSGSSKEKKDPQKAATEPISSRTRNRDKAPPAPPARDPNKTSAATQQVECIACTRVISNSNKMITCSCSCTYDSACLKEMIILSTNDEGLYPPRCCQQALPQETITKLLNKKELKSYKNKEVEYKTDPEDRIYCPRENCGRFVPPDRIIGGGSGKTRCGKCKIGICIHCKERFHGGECTKDKNTEKAIKLAEEMGWKRCPQCNMMVERSGGCLHITCKCGTQFCYTCGVKHPCRRH